MAKRLIPLFDRVLVQKVAAPSKSIGGVLLPESTVKVNKGTVLAVGPGRRAMDGSLVEPSVKEGDSVLLPEYGGTIIKLEEEEYSIFREEELLGILTE